MRCNSYKNDYTTPFWRYTLDPIMIPVPVKYLIGGGISTLTNLAVLYVLTSIFGIWYLLSATIAFVIGFLVSFSIQKFWTFSDNSLDALYHQAAVYLIITLGNVGLNALGMYLLVDRVHIWYLLAEVGMLALIAVESFFLYRIFVFKDRSSTTG